MAPSSWNGSFVAFGSLICLPGKKSEEATVFGKFNGKDIRFREVSMGQE